jgi:1-acyl-sn-glycerol-3-phosphate acyltransferase
MKDALENGRNVLIAAHNPDQDDEPRPGYGAAYLASIAGAHIIPVAVEYTPHKKSKWRKDVTVRIGEPFRLPDHEDLSKLAILMERRNSEEEFTEKEFEELRQQIKVLREFGGIVLQAVENLSGSSSDELAA